MSKELKEIRKQLRTIVRELFADVLTQELELRIEKKLMETITKRLDKIDERQKEITSFMVRQLGR